MTHRLSGKVLAFIRSQRVARLATVGPNGIPHNVPVCPLAASGRIYFASGKNARKVRNLRRNPHVALAFDHYAENWQRLAGVMVVGKCAVVDQGAAFRRIRQAIYRKYRQYARVTPIEENDTVIVRMTPTQSYSWGL
jgi:PPOX class probable F420-dependent enzyme